MTEISNLSFEQTLEHYIVLEKKNRRKSLVFVAIGAIIADVLFVMNLLLWREAPNFLFMLVLFGAGGGLMSWLTIDEWKKTDPKIPAVQAPIYNFLVSQAGSVTVVKEQIVFGSGRMKIIYKLPWQNSIESIENRMQLLNKHKNLRVSKSTFYFVDNNKKGHQLEIPSNEAPLFAKMIQEKMPQAKFGFDTATESIKVGV